MGEIRTEPSYLFRHSDSLCQCRAYLGMSPLTPPQGTCREPSSASPTLLTCSMPQDFAQQEAQSSPISVGGV